MTLTKQLEKGELLPTMLGIGREKDALLEDSEKTRPPVPVPSPASERHMPVPANSISDDEGTDSTAFSADSRVNGLGDRCHEKGVGGGVQGDGVLLPGVLPTLHPSQVGNVP